MKSVIQFTISLLVTLILITALNTRIGSIPPLGKFLNPIDGAWRNAIISDIPGDKDIQLTGLQDEVRIIYNDRAVPHIFAQNDHDLYMGMGYAMAQHRLWQMELSTMAAAGRVSEIVGSVALDYDRHQRRIGMGWGAEVIQEYMLQDEWTKMALEAYSKGVNAWINQLTPGTLPFEYKLLNYKPEPWTIDKTAIFYMNMNQTLTSGTNAYELSTIQSYLGRELTEILFPDFPPTLEPVITAGTEWPFEGPNREIPEGVFSPEFLSKEVISGRDPGVGSNNWAVSGEKTASGAAMMATDPHLTLSLPAIWYEIQLHAPGINTYGVTLPGVPGMIMGFNEHIAWGNTNTAWSGLDIFEIELNDDKTSYWHDDEWKPLTHRIETIHSRDGATVTDTTWFTHHGPIAYMSGEKSFSDDIPVGHAVQWIAHYPTNPMDAFRIINRGENFDDIREGLSRLGGPTQSYAFASTNGDIAMQTNGLNPLRYNGMGKYIMDGRNPLNDWDGFIPFNQLPIEVNPQRNYVSSANQHSTDEGYPHYMGWRYASEARASIINRTLENSSNITIQDMINLQLNSDNYRAEKWLDRMLDSTNAHIRNMEENTLPGGISSAMNILQQWNRKNEAQITAPLLFSLWIDNVEEALWAPFLGDIKSDIFRLPDLTVSLETLFHNYHPEVYDSVAGSMPYTGKLLTEALINAVDKHEKMGSDTKWGDVNGSTINHLLNIPALNQPRLQNDGSRESPNAAREYHGPSWRMVVEMTDPVQARGVYPGGQTGNPASSGYNAFITDWQHGNHYELSLFSSWEQAAYHGKSMVHLKPGN